MNYKKNKLYKILKTVGLVCLFSGLSVTKTNALEVEEITNLPGVQAGYSDSDVPVALKVTTAGDGIKAGAYLYRHIHQGVDYYAPWTPDAIVGTEADKNGTTYANWGFWNMAVNKAAHNITATYYYDSGTIKTGGASGLNADGKSAGTLPAGTVIKIYGIDSVAGKVYVHADDYSQLSKGTSTSDMIALNVSSVTFSGTKKNIVYTGYASDTYLQNFKKYAKYADNTATYHRGLVKAKWTNSDATSVPESVRGKTGEWRYIGYNRYGDPLDNPYFVGDTQNGYSAQIYSASRRHTPWDKTDGATTGESDPATAYNTFIKGMSSKSLNFEYDKLSQYSAMKDYVVDKLYSLGAVKTKSNVKNEISLRTNAYKQGIVMKNQRKYYVYYGVPFIEGTLRDLYAYSMEIWELETNTKVATLSGSATTSKVSEVGQYIPGRSYEVRLRLGNGANATLIKKSLEAHFGLVYNASSISNTMAFNKTKSQTTLTQGNYGGLTSTKGSKSNEFIFKFKTNSTQTGPIDVYGFVGFSHTGVDNLNYKNDLIGIRLAQGSVPSTDANCTITNNGKTKTCGKADIRPLSIQLIDENGVVQYEHDATSGVTIKNAIVPGKKYKIQYSARVYDGSVTVSNWVEAVSDNPNTSANEYVPGYWSDPVPATVRVPFTYNISRPVKNPTTTESYSYNGSTIYLSRNGSLDVPITKNITMGYTTGYMVMQYPKLTTSFTIKCTDVRANSITSNDTMSTTLTDTFDIGVSNLVASPIRTYTDGKEETVAYNVTYDAALTTPSYVTTNDYQAYVNTAININGQTFNVKDQLIKGNNTKLTHVVNNVKVPASGDITVSINVNSDKLSYESGNYDNNKASVTVKTEAVKNPGAGSVNDTVKTPVQDDNSPTAGGNANNNCLIPRNKNTWTSTHRKLSWSSNSVTYNTLVTGESVTFKNYKLDYYNASEATDSYEENFAIKQILFKSKETTENGYGTNGWVDLLVPAQAKYAEVKAGYGFELKIVTNYNTNALTKRTWTISNNGSSGTDVSLMNGGINYGMEEVFLELPGTKDTRKILSTTGYGDSIKGLNVSKSGSGSNVTWTYTIKPSNTVGSGETPKVFIPTNMKDGDYKLKIYTTPVQGVGSANKKQYSALCDRKEVIIKVKGSASNDLESNIIQ